MKLSYEAVQRINRKIETHKRTDLKRFGREGDITLQNVIEKFQEQEGKCWVCNEPVLTEGFLPYCCYQLSIDRIRDTYPHDADNFMIACYYCNCRVQSGFNQANKICNAGCHTESKPTLPRKMDCELGISHDTRLHSDSFTSLHIRENQCFWFDYANIGRYKYYSEDAFRKEYPRLYFEHIKQGNWNREVSESLLAEKRIIDRCEPTRTIPYISDYLVSKADCKFTKDFLYRYFHALHSIRTDVEEYVSVPKKLIKKASNVELEGVCPLDIQNLCRQYDFNYTCIDSDDEVVCSYYSGNDAPWICHASAGGRFYPIETPPDRETVYRLSFEL